MLPVSNLKLNSNEYNPQSQISKFLDVVRQFRSQQITTYTIEEDRKHPVFESNVNDPKPDVLDAPAQDPGPSTRVGGVITSAYKTARHFVLRHKKVVIFLSSFRRDNQGLLVCGFLKKEMEKFKMAPVIFDPREFMDYLIEHPSQAELNDTKITPAWLEKYNKEIVGSNGFIVLCPEYQSEESLPSPLITMLDLFPSESFAGKPCGIIAYSPGNYHGDQEVGLLRQHLSIFNKMAHLPFNAIIPNINKYFNEDETTFIKINYGKIAVRRLLQDLQYYLENGCIMKRSNSNVLDFPVSDK